MSTVSLDVARYKRLAIRSADTWQGGLFRLPMWIQERDADPPYRPVGAFWRSVRTGLIWIRIEPQPRTANAELALRALLEFAKKHERELVGRPARIEVPNARFAEELGQLLDDRDTAIAVVEDQPEVHEALRELGERETGPLPRGLLETPGVTVEHVRRFAEAACEFYQGEPWEALEPEDLVAVDIPGLDSEMRYLVVTGTSRETRGIMFYGGRDQFERFRRHPPTSGKKPRMWIVAFDPIDDLPFADVDAWEDLTLPVAAVDAYPRPGLVLPTDSLVRPDARRLAHLEAILRALTATTDDEFDAGEWTRQVETAEGAVTVRLSLPQLLEQMAGKDLSDAPADADGRIADLRFHLERALRRAGRAARSADTSEDAARLVEETLNASTVRPMARNRCQQLLKSARRNWRMRRMPAAAGAESSWPARPWRCIRTALTPGRPLESGRSISIVRGSDMARRSPRASVLLGPTCLRRGISGKPLKPGPTCVRDSRWRTAWRLPVRLTKPSSTIATCCVWIRPTIRPCAADFSSAWLTRSATEMRSR